MNDKVLVGTSGYSFADWVGTVYPPNARARDFLPLYAELFDAVEINATYYRTPSPQTFARMVERTASDFAFVVKVPRGATHERAALDREVGPFLEAIEPLRRAGRLRGLLAQFPTSFHPNETSRRHLEHLAAAFPRDVPLAVELRRDDWISSSTFALLERLGLAFVNVDLPVLPGLPRPSETATSPVGYVRLHGRNAAAWWARGAEAGDRYDYLYSPQELEGWAERVERLAARTDVTFAFANNCHLGQSVVNALQLRARLGQTEKRDATTLFAPTRAER
ncbi:MAG: DUF72 domain-containing protein, partial [Candidatus Bipolaricaulota bacterium]